MYSKTTKKFYQLATTPTFSKISTTSDFRSPEFAIKDCNPSTPLGIKTRSSVTVRKYANLSTSFGVSRR